MTAPTGTYMFESPSILGGTYSYIDPADPNATQTLSFVAGHDAESTQALSFVVHSETWGAGMGLWFACMDASAYTGVTFWARGSAPSGPVELLLTTNDAVRVAEGGTCPDAGPCASPKVTVMLTDTWTQFTYAWGEFTPGDAAGTPVPATGNNVIGLNFNMGNDSTPNDLELVIDDFEFTTE
jgi:hypothetical protein